MHFLTIGFEGLRPLGLPRFALHGQAASRSCLFYYAYATSNSAEIRRNGIRRERSQYEIAHHRQSLKGIQLFRFGFAEFAAGHASVLLELAVEEIDVVVAELFGDGLSAET